MTDRRKMNRLIPLRLGTALDLRPESPTSSYTFNPPPIPPRSPHRRSKLAAAYSGAVEVPRTQKQWKKAMAAIRTLFQNRQYRLCTTRCLQILENIVDSYRVHPLYLIYLSFYAASSLELTALPTKSNKRLTLLQQALAQYQNAESYMEYASVSCDPSTVLAAHKRSTSITSSIRSSTDSVFSQPSSPLLYSRASSAPSSPSSLHRLARPDRSKHKRTSPLGIAEPAPLEVGKNGTYCSSYNLSQDSEVYLWTESSLAALDESSILDAFPTPPQTPILMEEATDSISSFLLDQSLSRYRDHLSDFQAILANNITSVSTKIEALKYAPSEKSKGDLSPALDHLGFDGVDRTALRKLELQARIERLRKGGWKRERFNAERYRAVCERALSEIG